MHFIFPTLSFSSPPPPPSSPLLLLFPLEDMSLPTEYSFNGLSSYPLKLRAALRCWFACRHPCLRDFAGIPPPPPFLLPLPCSPQSSACICFVRRGEGERKDVESNCKPHIRYAQLCMHMLRANGMQRLHPKSFLGKRRGGCQWSFKLSSLKRCFASTQFFLLLFQGLGGKCPPIQEDRITPCNQSRVHDYHAEANDRFPLENQGFRRQ